MNSLIPAQFGAISKVFAGQQAVDDLSAGVQASFGLLGYKGKVWTVKYRGDERRIMRADGDGPENSVQVIILKAATVISKIWYENGYVEGSNAPPDCFSNNGVTPEPSSAKLQNPVCATCKQNVWGSRITPAGKQGKACADNKRLAIVPLLDIPNEAFGGPMLLRVPPASLQDLSTFGTQMQRLGFHYYAIGTRISFDPAEAYPKFLFNAIRPLTDQEAEQVLQLRESPLVGRILSETITEAGAAATTTTSTMQTAFEQPPPASGTGGAPISSAPPAATTGQATQASPSTGSAPASPAPSSSPPVATGSDQKLAGGATTVVSGFGAVEAAPQAAQSSPTEPAPQSQGQPVQMTREQVPQSAGFGNLASVPAAAAPAEQAPAQATSAPPASQPQQANGAAPVAFDDELEAKLAALMPAG